ncbi:aminoglycoside phosphotransferase family protein [Actinoplanes missouriensis]|uniref:phosphotransferase family protein n=1 Tax=Actinoplanes missouriensis TaxID=1866 RepID=UPI003409F6AD
MEIRPVTLPDVPYDATSVRPDWAGLPRRVREAISRRLGSPVSAARSAGGGFTRAFAALLTTEAGTSAFVKAAPLREPTAEWYAREAAVTHALPAEVPAARPLWTLAEAGWFVLALEPIDGRIPALPWQPAALDAALTAWSVSARALAEPPAGIRQVGLPALPDILRHEMSWWSLIESGHEPIPSAARGTLAPHRLRELAALERALPPKAAGSGVCHGDLRIDNVLLDNSGKAWLCDWTWPCLGAPWYDAITLLISAYASGLDADAYISAWNPPPGGVDGALAALAGYWLVRASDGPSSASPHSRQHQRFSGGQALAWLASRQGWDTP